MTEMSEPTDIRRADLEALGRALADMASAALFYRIKLYPRGEPQPGSIAWTDLTRQRHYRDPGVWGNQAVQQVYDIAVAQIALASDHLHGMQHLLTAPCLTTFSINSLARPVVEACARACWLLDHEIDTPTRVARGMTVRLDTMNEYAKEERRFTGAESYTGARISRLAAAARRQGYTVVEDKKKRPVAIERRPPNATDLIAKMFSILNEGDKLGRALYSDFSGVSHAQINGIIPRIGPAVALGEGRWQGHGDPGLSISRAVPGAVLAFDILVFTLIRICGWDPTWWLAVRKGPIHWVGEVLTWAAREPGNAKSEAPKAELATA